MRREPHPESALPDDDHDYWWACTAPEKPRDRDTCYLDECRACVVALAAAVHYDADWLVYRRDDDGTFLEALTAGEAFRSILDSADTVP